MDSCSSVSQPAAFHLAAPEGHLCSFCVSWLKLMSIPYWQFDLLSLKLQVCSLFCLSRMEFVRWRTVVPREGKGLTAEEAIGSSHSEKTINVLLCITCLQTTAEEEKEKDRKRAATSWQTKDHWSKKRLSSQSKDHLMCICVKHCLRIHKLTFEGVWHLAFKLRAHECKHIEYQPH